MKNDGRGNPKPDARVTPDQTARDQRKCCKESNTRRASRIVMKMESAKRDCLRIEHDREYSIETEYTTSIVEGRESGKDADCANQNE